MEIDNIINNISEMNDNTNEIVDLHVVDNLVMNTNMNMNMNLSDEKQNGEKYNGDLEEHNYGSEPSDSDNNSIDGRSDGACVSFKYNKLSYNDVKEYINKSYQPDIVHRYSSALDILASYVKGQKIIYMESRDDSVKLLNCLMLPSIFITATVSIIQIPLQNTQYGPIILAALSAFVAFLLAIINYLKLEAESEAHKISSHKYDKLQSFIEFQSGQVLLFSDPVLNHKDNGNGNGNGKGKDNGNGKNNNIKINGDSYDYQVRLEAEVELIGKMRETIKLIAERIEEVKVINQFIIPSNIRSKYSLIYNINIFSVIKKIDDYKAKTLTDLKNVKNELRFINSMQKQKINTYNKRAAVLFKKKKMIIDTILYLNTAFSMIDKMFQHEIDTVKLKQNNSLSFFINDIFMRCCGCLINDRSTCCLPVGYIPKDNYSEHILEKIMGMEFHESIV